MTARRRASDNAFHRGMPATDKTSDKQGTQTTAAAPDETEPQHSKYTTLLDADTATAFDELALTARKALGRKVDKSRIVRELIMLAADDASLREQLIDQIRDQQ